MYLFVFFVCFCVLVWLRVLVCVFVSLGADVTSGKASYGLQSGTQNRTSTAVGQNWRSSWYLASSKPVSCLRHMGSWFLTRAQTARESIARIVSNKHRNSNTTFIANGPGASFFRTCGITTKPCGACHTHQAETRTAVRSLCEVFRVPGPSTCLSFSPEGPH